MAAASVVLKVHPSRLPWLQTIFAPSCLQAGLTVRAFKGTPNMHGAYHIFVEISADTERLMREAARLEFPLQLDCVELRRADIARNEQLTRESNIKFALGDNEFVEKDIPQLPATCSTRCLGASADPYEHIWAPFLADPKLRSLYYIHKRTNSILSSMQALKLLLEAIESPSMAGGAGLNLDHLRLTRFIESWFIPHDPAEVDQLKKTWATRCQMPWDPPIAHIKNYLGERVAFYYSFLAFITMWLLLPALIGTGIFAHQVYTHTPSVNYLPAYGIFVSLWSTVFFEFWKRRQSAECMKWGMSDFHKTEPLRPEYYSSSTVQRVRSPITGRPDLFESPIAVRARLAVTSTIVGTLLGSVVVAVGCLFILRVLLVDKDQEHAGFIPVGWPDYITSILNGLQIQIFNIIYSWLATKLCAWENHPTQSSHDRSLTIKLALFYSINSYFSLLYIAAIKSHITIAGQQQSCQLNSQGVPDCMEELQQQLAILMITKFFFTIGFEIGTPYVMHLLSACYVRCKYRGVENKQKIKKLREARSVIEREAERPQMSLFFDYINVIILIGFVSLFVSAFPLAPAIALIFFYVDLRWDTSKVLFHQSRPVPEGAQDIGAWLMVFECLSYLSTVTNLTIVVFTNTNPLFDFNWSWSERLTFFVICEHVVLLLKYALASWIPDVAFPTRIQLERQNYLVGKHIFGRPERADALEAFSATGGVGIMDEAGTPVIAAPQVRKDAEFRLFDSYDAMQQADPSPTSSSSSVGMSSPLAAQTTIPTNPLAAPAAAAGGDRLGHWRRRSAAENGATVAPGAGGDESAGTAPPVFHRGDHHHAPTV